MGLKSWTSIESEKGKITFRDENYVDNDKYRREDKGSGDEIKSVKVTGTDLFSPSLNPLVRVNMSWFVVLYE